MKSPTELAQRLARQWSQTAYRESRLLGADPWPIVLPIGRPASKRVTSDLDSVKRHMDLWRRVPIGTVVWEPVSYRSVDAPVNVPVRWELHCSEEWVQACGDKSIQAEYAELSDLFDRTHEIFHRVWVRRPGLWRKMERDEVVQAARVAENLEPGCADGRPLRMLGFEGIDTKFFERNQSLVTALLDCRFEGEVSRVGLEAFLGASREGERWVLLLDLDGELLPFEKLRVRSSELRGTGPPGTHVLIVENEGCQRHLPRAPGTIAILGAGFDLTWTEASWMKSRTVAYWGDLDTWGLQFLASARRMVPHLEALMMNSRIYNDFRKFAVPEPVSAASEAPAGLTSEESELYFEALSSEQGRLEQEFLDPERARRVIEEWAKTGAGASSHRR